MNGENPANPMDQEVPTNALSVYGQDAAVEDFPVLKAFQQYIDAEQSKSRKRMVMLCMFFGVLMTVIVAVFVFMLNVANRDKQQVNDQLIQYLLKERERQNVIIQQTPAQTPAAANPANDAALKAMTDTLVAMQKQMADDRRAQDEKDKKAAEEAAAAAKAAKAEAEAKAAAAAKAEAKAKTEAAVKAAAAAAKAEAEEKARAEMQRLNAERQAEIEKLKRAKELLDAKEKKIAEEKERLRQEEIERYRRRNFPYLYENTPSQPTQPKASSPSVPATKKPAPAPSRTTVAADDDAAFDANLDAIVNNVKSSAPKAESVKPTDTKPAKEDNSEKPKKTYDQGINEEGAIQYFSEADGEYSIPVDESNANSPRWRIGIE